MNAHCQRLRSSFFSNRAIVCCIPFALPKRVPQSDTEASKAEYKEDSASKGQSEANFYGIRADPLIQRLFSFPFALAISFLSALATLPFLAALLLAAGLSLLAFLPLAALPLFAHSDNGVKVSLGKHYRAVGYALSRKIFMECPQVVAGSFQKVLVSSANCLILGCFQSLL